MKINKTPESEEYTLKLNHAEALVLFDWIIRFNEMNEVPDKAEKILLHELECLLESSIEESFAKNYIEQLNIAKNKILNGESESI